MLDGELEQDGVEFNIINPPGSIFQHFPNETFDSAAEDQHILRIRVLKRR